MDTLETIAGKNGCGTKNANTGRKGCQIEFGTPTHLFELTKGTVIPKATVLNLVYLNSLTQKNTMTPIVGASAFEDLSAEDAVSANASGVERINLYGLPKYKFMYEEGHEFYRELSKMTTFKNSDYFIGDERGNLKIALNSAGDFVGFTAGQVLAEMTKNKVVGGDSESKSLTIQFLNRKQFDEDYTIIGFQELDYDLLEVQGANGVDLQFDAVPANLATTIVINTLLNSDKSSPVTLLVKEDFLVKVDGSTAAISTAVETPTIPGQYTLTISALATGEVVVVDLWDGTLNSDRILNNGVIYASDVVSEIVV